jgi:predicted transposase/invertase (TIGR01784 family)
MMTEMDRVASLMWAEEKGVMRGRDEGRADGIAIGSLRQAQSMAKRMLAKNYPLEEIEALTGLSEPEILSLEE